MLLSNLDLLATAPSGVARLRELILSLAVQGKLVPQDAADEPTSVLMQKIRAEKDRLITEGKIRRDKSLAEIAADEKPFELPQGWAWVRLAALAEFENGDRGSNYPSRSEFVEHGVAFINAGHLVDERVDYSDMNYITPQNFALLRSGKVQPGDILYCLRGSLGKFAQVTDNSPGAIASSLVIVRPIVSAVVSYAVQYLKSPLAEGQIKRFDNGTAQPNLGAGDLAKFVVPLPPLAEQSRIVARVKELMRLCDALEAKGQLEATQHAQLVSTLLGALTASATPEELADNWQRVAQHFDLLLDRPEAIDALEQTLLQLAVRGLLVPQDPTDEPASALLQKIRAEKDRLIATGQIKQGKPLPPITDEEKPFELPVGWEWVRINDLAEVQGGIQKTQLRTPVKQHFPYLRVANVQRDALRLEEIERFELTMEELERWRLIAGDLLVVEGNGSAEEIGRCAVWTGAIDPCVYQNHLIRVRCFQQDCMAFIKLFLNAPSGAEEMKRLAITTSGLYNLSVGKIRNYAVPMAPLAEQSRIVTRVTALRRLCADLRLRLADRQSVQARLAEALVQEVA